MHLNLIVINSDADPQHEDDDDDRRSSGDSFPERENIPMDSIVVNIEGGPAGGTKQVQDMESAI